MRFLIFRYKNIYFKWSFDKIITPFRCWHKRIIQKQTFKQMEEMSNAKLLYIC